MQKQIMGVAALGAALAIGDASYAQVVQWKVSDGGNGHWYSIVPAIPGMNAATIVAGAYVPGGHPVSISSVQENQFVIGLMESSSVNGAWIGYLRGGDGIFQWIDGSEVTWQGWGGSNCGAGPYPNDGGTSGEVGVKIYNRTIDCGWNWDDIPYAWETIPVVVEWSADCNNDGIVDYGQCRDGSLPDYNGNNIPDCCETGTPCVVGQYPVQWRVSDGGNGHWYQLRLRNSVVSWGIANAECLAGGADLASILSEAEDKFVFMVADRPGAWQGYLGPWLGGRQVPGSGEPLGVWEWSSGEQWGYVGPDSSFPNNGGRPGTDENRLHYIDFVRKWNDLPENGSPENGGGVRGFVIEWSADCNNDDIVDFGQILQGQLSDSNLNGIPDVCENILRVPEDRPTIQAAIDGVAGGQATTILVAAGTYQGPIDFQGKNVVVRGAGAGSTIIQGSGGQVSAVVRFSGGEPASAVLERCTVRGGLTGSPIPQAPQFLVGGGLFANESAANVRDCVFEDNFASYGGGAYLRNSTTMVERCTFRLNRAGAFGGGLQFLNSQTAMTDCIIEQNTCESRGGGLHVFNGTTTLTRVSITSNSSTTVMGGISFDHAGDPFASLQLVDCTVTGNTAAVSQGGIGVLAAPATTRMSLLETTVCANVPRPNISGPWQDLGGNTVCICVGDLTGNDFVNGDDLGMFLAAWGPCVGEDCPADFNDDGVVDGIDLGQLLAAWGPCPN